MPAEKGEPEKADPPRTGGKEWIKQASPSWMCRSSAIKVRAHKRKDTRLDRSEQTKQDEEEKERETVVQRH